MEGRLMEMLRGIENLTLAFLNHAAQAWVEQDYHRKHASGNRRDASAADARRPECRTPGAGRRPLHLAFTRQIIRTPRRGDATVVVDGVRYELPPRFGHLRTVTLRSPSWDKSQMTLVDPQTGGPVARLLPQDKAENASACGAVPSPPVPRSPTAPQKACDAGLIAQMARRLCRHRIAPGLSAQGGMRP